MSQSKKMQTFAWLVMKITQTFDMSYVLFSYLCGIKHKL